MYFLLYLRIKNRLLKTNFRTVRTFKIDRLVIRRYNYIDVEFGEKRYFFRV